MTIFTAPKPLDDQCRVEDFSCGKPALDNWLRKTALKSNKRNHARTFVVTTEDNIVAGYYALAMGGLERKEADKKLQRNAPDPLPILLLARLAVDTKYHGQGIAKGLLKDVYLRAIEMSKSAGMVAIVTHAIDEEAALFYKKHGFLSSPIKPHTLMLPINQLY